MPSGKRPSGSERARRRPGTAPARIPVRRTTGDVLAGLAALLALVLLVGGVPFALLTLVKPPLSAELLDPALLTGGIGPSTVVSLLILLVWLAWFQLFACVLVEVYAGVRRVGMPSRVPLSGGTQALVNRLVSATLVLFAAGAVAAPAVSAATSQAGPVKAEPVAYAAPVETVAKSKKVYVVQPPHGRHHESLWEIAEKCLGDGRRYPEIYRLNQHKPQPDGARLHIADLIRPGWVLDMPDDARNVHIVPRNQRRAETLEQFPGRAAAPRPRAETGKPYQPRPEQPRPEQTRPEQTRSESPETTRQAKPTAGRETPPTTEDTPLDLAGYLTGASLTAAGLLLALAGRRRKQLWRRPLGRRLARPRDDAASAEVALRLGADAPGARMLDTGLRLLGAELAAQERTPPTIYAAHLSARTLDLWVHPPSEDAPHPWTARDGGQVWRLPAHEGRLLEERQGGAPYPGLVSLGVDRLGRILIDLEAAQGLIAVTGPQATAALAATAVELATNRWSDRMRITLVGFGEELTAIAPERVRAVGGLAEVLPELEAAATPRDQVLRGRVGGSPRIAHYLLCAVAPTRDEARRLALLARRDSAGYVVAGEIPHATWTIRITEDGRAVLGELGLETRAQLLPRRHYRALVDLFATTERLDGEAVPEAEPLDVRRPPDVELRLLGPIEIVGVTPLEEGRMELAAELLTYLATHPDGVHPAVLGGVLWPRGAPPAVPSATIARVADWLGPEHLGTDAAGRLRLGPGVRTDWALFRELARRARIEESARIPLLERALSLVRGPLLSGRPPGRYAWLAADELEYDVAAGVADAAHRLCEARLAQGEPEAAVAAVRAGLLLAVEDEALWRDLLRATHLTGDLIRLRAVVEGLTRRSASHPYGGGLAPETEALIDELLPSWRLREARESMA